MNQYPLDPGLEKKMRINHKDAESFQKNYIVASKFILKTPWGNIRHTGKQLGQCINTINCIIPVFLKLKLLIYFHPDASSLQMLHWAKVNRLNALLCV